VKKFPLTTESPFSISRHITIGTEESGIEKLVKDQINFSIFLTQSQNDRWIRRIAFIPSSQDNEPLHWINSESILYEIFEQQSDTSKGK
jgi:hypothetical protein